MTDLIKKAMEPCRNTDEYGESTHGGLCVRCFACNDTGFECGVTPTAVERHMFDLVNAAKGLRKEGSLDDALAVWILKRLTAAAQGLAVDDNLDAAEVYALANRRGDE